MAKLMPASPFTVATAAGLTVGAAGLASRNVSAMLVAQVPAEGGFEWQSLATVLGTVGGVAFAIIVVWRLVQSQIGGSRDVVELMRAQMRDQAKTIAEQSKTISTQSRELERLRTLLLAEDDA